MVENVWFTAGIWMALGASLISIWTGVSVSLWSGLAVILVLLAQQFFRPTMKTMHAWGRLYRRKQTVRLNAAEKDSACV